MSSPYPRKPDPNKVNRLANGFYGSAVLFAASDLGIFAELSRTRKSDAAAIARDLNLNPRGLTFLLDACAALGLVEKDGDSYRNSPEADNYLVPGGPFDLSAAVRDFRHDYPVWSMLADFVRTGAAVAPQPPVATNGHDGAADNLLLTHARALAMGRAVVRRLELQGRRKLLDVGGGAGTYSVLISLEFPQIRCTVLDRPEVIGIASTLIHQQDASQRVTTLAGDYRTAPFPAGMDVVTFFGILHRHSAETARRLLKRAAEALVPGGLVYVVDVMTDDTHTEPPPSVLFALNLALAGEDGSVFPYAELQNWMEGAGFRDFGVESLPPPLPYWLAHARKPL